MAATSTNGRTVKQQLAILYQPILADLAKAEVILREELRSSSDFVEELTNRVELYRGKRLRPALLLLSAQACGAIQPEHHTLAAVVEMIHAATLVHDDVLDDADHRRHVTTVNAEWGNEASVLLGDYLFTHAFSLAASLESTLACRLIGQATNLVCEGELHQIARRGRFQLTEAEYLSILAGKTAELIACSCRLGAHFAGAAAAVEASLELYGRQLGIAFQIADDLLDLLGDGNTTGKTVGTDWSKQKMTLPLIRFRDTAAAAAVEECQRLFEQPGLDQRAIVVELLRKTDALEYARWRSREFAQSAARQLSQLPDSPARDLLHTATQFVVDRTA